MRKLTTLKTKDNSELYVNEHDVLIINSKHKTDIIKINDDIIYSESVFTTTGKDKWLNLINEYDYRCYILEMCPNIPTVYESSTMKPVYFMKDSVFSLTINAIKDLIRSKLL